MEEQELYQRMYYHLFNAITDALAQMEQQNYGMAVKRLKRAQQETEEMYMDAGDAPETPT